MAAAEIDNNANPAVGPEVNGDAAGRGREEEEAEAVGVAGGDAGGPPSSSSATCGATWLLYAVVSGVVAAAAVYHAFESRERMFAAVVYLVRSKVNLAILGNFVLVLLVEAARWLTWMFLGRIASDELERVWSAARVAFIELCFDLTVFREELSTETAIRFAILLFAKYFHVLFDARVDNLERHGLVGWCKHASLLSGMLGFVAFDALLAAGYTQLVLDAGPSVALLFAFEHAVLGLTLLLTVYRYLLWSIEQRMGQEWWAKSSYFVWGSLIVNILKLALNALYLYSVFRAYGFPLIMFREIVESWSAVRREIATIIGSWQLRRMVSERFDLLSVAECENLQDKTCVCCFQDVGLADHDAVRLPCSHVFHVHCLMRWFDHAQACPTCRLELFSAEAERLMELRDQQRRGADPAAPAPAPARSRHVRPRPRPDDAGDVIRGDMDDIDVDDASEDRRAAPDARRRRTRPSTTDRRASAAAHDDSASHEGGGSLRRRRRPAGPGGSESHSSREVAAAAVVTGSPGALPAAHAPRRLRTSAAATGSPVTPTGTSTSDATPIMSAGGRRLRPAAGPTNATTTTTTTATGATAWSDDDDDDGHGPSPTTAASGMTDPLAAVTPQDAAASLAAASQYIALMQLQLQAQAEAQAHSQAQLMARLGYGLGLGLTPPGPMTAPPPPPVTPGGSLFPVAPQPFLSPPAPLMGMAPHPSLTPAVPPPPPPPAGAGAPAGAAAPLPSAPGWGPLVTDPAASAALAWYQQQQQQQQQYQQLVFALMSTGYDMMTASYLAQQALASSSSAVAAAAAAAAAATTSPPVMRVPPAALTPISPPLTLARPTAVAAATAAPGGDVESSAGVTPRSVAAGEGLAASPGVPRMQPLTDDGDTEAKTTDTAAPAVSRE